MAPVFPEHGKLTMASSLFGAVIIVMTLALALLVSWFTPLDN